MVPEAIVAMLGNSFVVSTHSFVLSILFLSFLVPFLSFSYLSFNSNSPACARVGAVHSVVFGGFSGHELAKRIEDAQPKLILSARYCRSFPVHIVLILLVSIRSCGIEPSHVVDYKPMLDLALSTVEKSKGKEFLPKQCVILQRPEGKVDILFPGRFRSDNIFASVSAGIWQRHRMARICAKRPVFAFAPLHVAWCYILFHAGKKSDCVKMNGTDPLYILYTSGTTGAPKGVVRDVGGYTVALRWSMEKVFGMKPGQIWWCARFVDPFPFFLFWLTVSALLFCLVILGGWLAILILFMLH
jgi:propionyl-CoA synthetase